MFKRIILVFSFFILATDVRSQLDSAGNIICLIPSAPQFPGGNIAFKKYIKDNLKWPAPDWCGQGAVYVKFKVDCKGHVSEETILRGIDSLANKEVLKLIKQMPKWIPETCDTWPSDTWYSLPIKFK